MTSPLTVEIQGLEKLRRKARPEVLGPPVRDFMLQTVQLIEAEVKQRTPVDTGPLHASITHRVDPAPWPLWGEVGTNVRYAPAVEYGTAPHVVPREEIEPWARRHHIPVEVVIAAIARAGTRPRYMFDKGMAAAQKKIPALVRMLAAMVERAWARQ